MSTTTCRDAPLRTPRRRGAPLAAVVVALQVMVAVMVAATPVTVRVAALLPSRNKQLASALSVAVALANAAAPANASVALALSFVDEAGEDGVDTLRALCAAGVSGVSVLLGPEYSSDATAVASLARGGGWPVLAFSATAPSLNNPVRYPTFFRVVPSDEIVAAAAAALLRRVGVKRVGVLAQADT